jgi:hypothetical protein
VYEPARVVYLCMFVCVRVERVCTCVYVGIFERTIVKVCAYECLRVCTCVGIFERTIVKVCAYECLRVCTCGCVSGLKRVFITNVKGTFFGMSESEEASKRR